MLKRRALLTLIFAFALLSGAGARSQSLDPLPSWNDGAVKKSITDFVTRVTTQGNADFVPAEQRIATFDNDGTLWCEQPIYFQFAFMLDRIRAMAPQHPQWKTTQPFKAIIERDTRAMAAADEKGLLQIVATTHAGMTTEQFSRSVLDWIATARHPRFNRPYTELVYQPMLELLAYLRASGFKTFVVSGGGVEFMRPWMEKVYGIPPEQVVGSSGVVKFEVQSGKPVLIKQAKVEFVDDGPGKPVGINRFIGRRPIFAFGNSDGDLQMLQWTTAGAGARFAGLVHHTDAEREYAYDRQSKIGKLDKALDEATAKGWSVVDMKRDWKEISEGSEAMSGFDIFAWIVLIILVASAIGVFCIAGWLPGHIAKTRDHPQAQAVTVAGWVTLICGFALWPVALIWAYVDVPAARARE